MSTFHDIIILISFLYCFSVPVAESKETYLFASTGTCAGNANYSQSIRHPVHDHCCFVLFYFVFCYFYKLGLVQSVYVPPGPTVNSSFAVLQEPFAMQRFIEAAAQARWKKFPKWYVNHVNVYIYIYVHIHIRTYKYIKWHRKPL